MSIEQEVKNIIENSLSIGIRLDGDNDIEVSIYMDDNKISEDYVSMAKLISAMGVDFND